MSTMTHRLLVRAVCALGLTGLIAQMGCSTIGDPGGQPSGLPHGGTGQFRPLEADETGITSPLLGRAMVLTNAAIESAAPVGLEHVFYAQAAVLDEPPELPMDHPRNEVFWPAFEARTIRRGEPYVTERQPNIIGGFVQSRDDVLTATEEWEGGEVFDPWPVVTDDGTTRLYYAAAGGIGVAEASSVDGSFSKVAGPILGEVNGAIPRRPSVVPGLDGGWLMYFDADGAIGVARSDDGIAFEAAGPLTFDGPDETDSPEVARANPGAVRVVTPIGRALIRLYYESVRADGSHLIYVGASDDGERFELHPRPALDTPDARFPAPVLLDDRVTFLYVNLPFFGGAFQTRALVVAVSPAGESYAPEDEEAE